MTTVDENRTGTLHSLVPFARHLGVEVLEWSGERVRLRLGWSADYCTAGGVLHGGVIMTLADTAGAACAYSNLPAAATGTTTIESKTNFFRGPSQGSVTAVSTPLHGGRTVIVVETDVFDERDKRVARVTQTQAVLTG